MNKHFSQTLAIVCALTISLTGMTFANATPRQADLSVFTTAAHMKTPRVLHTRPQAPTPVSTPTDFSYHGGPVMTNPANLYLIWYGNWPKFSRKKPVVQRFLKALGNTPYYWINSSYTQANGEHVSRSLTVAQEIVDPYSLGKNIQDSDVATIVSNAITNNSGFQTSSHIPDINGIYVVITSSDVRNYSGFLTSYCGWHTVATMSKVATKFIFAGDPSSDMSVCAPPSNRKQSPNGYPGMDALASTLAHEISETVTDPELTAWMDSNNRENADLCAWQYGTTYASNSALANLRFAYNDYLIQENWSLRKGGLCDLK